jgi:ribosomal protein L16 Arg81 hydroxylase
LVPDESDNGHKGSETGDEDEEENEEEYEDDIVVAPTTGNSIIEEAAAPSVIDNILEIFNKQTHWYMILIGEENGGMFHHVDNLPVGSWQVQVSGKKEWIICSPLESQDGDSNSYTSNGKDFLNPENDNTCYKAILNPGDLLFYPMGFSHETISLSTPTVSISGTLIPLKDYRLLKTLIRKECQSSTIGYRFHQILCMLVNEKETL